jgi:hypothetical protein
MISREGDDMDGRETPRYIALTPVRADRRSAFESFIRDVVVPAVEQVRPDLRDKWEVLVPAQAADGGDENYALLFYGEATLQDWDLPTLLTAAYGEEDGPRRFEEFEQLLSGDQLVGGFSGSLGRAT